MDGFLLVDKPAGITSHDVIDVLRRRLREKQVGHGGTLDPLATGLLLCALGSATRALEYLAPHDKEYEGTLRLGFETDTGDITGKVTRSEPLNPLLTQSAIVAATGPFVGDLDQVPPVYSAVKVEGRPAHRRVRSGETVDLGSRRVHVSRFEIASLSLPDAAFSVTCSTGTYVRALVRDLGRALGCGATLASLRRVRIGPYRVAEALPLDRVGPGMAGESIRSIDEALSHLPRLRVRAESERRIRTGTTCGAEDLADPPLAGVIPGPARCVVASSDAGDRFAGIASIEALDPLVFRLHKNLLGPIVSTGYSRPP